MWSPCRGRSPCRRCHHRTAGSSTRPDRSRRCKTWSRTGPLTYIALAGKWVGHPPCPRCLGRSLRPRRRSRPRQPRLRPRVTPPRPWHRAPHRLAHRAPHRLAHRPPHRLVHRPLHRLPHRPPHQLVHRPPHRLPHRLPWHQPGVHRRRRPRLRPHRLAARARRHLASLSNRPTAPPGRPTARPRSETRTPCPEATGCKTRLLEP